VSDAVATTFAALGTTATVVVTAPDRLPAARDRLAADLDALDAAASRFRPDSELARLDTAGGRPVEVSPLLFDALEAALRAARLSGGCVTPTLGRSLRLAGYDRDFARLGPTAEPPRFLAAPDWRRIRLDHRRHRVAVPDGTALDLGASAKAFAADRAAVTLADALGCGVLVSLGGDLRAAGPPPAGGWRVWIDEAHDERTPAAAEVRLDGGALATSSTRRRWRRGGVSLHHILDPATGRSARSPWGTVSVAAATCLDANTASTAAIVLGSGAPAWLAAQGLPARLAGRAGVTVVGGWPDEAPGAAAA
jgi:FAD:protein FMN transferase